MRRISAQGRGGKKYGTSERAEGKTVNGAVAKGHQRKFAIEVFEKVIEPFAGYGFNRHHAACYAMISISDAFLKAHYPSEFMAALLSADADNTDRIIWKSMNATRRELLFCRLSINESFLNFTVVDSKHSFGLGAIKGLGGGKHLERND